MRQNHAHFLEESNLIKPIQPSADHLKLNFGGYSTQGKKSENQDAFALKVTQGSELELKGHVAVIADGVSSANCAAQASQMSVCHFIDEYLATPPTWSVQRSVTTVISALNNWLYSRQLINTPQGELEQWLSTFSAVIFRENRAHLFHIGDCQVVKINQHGHQILTKEHATPTGILNRALGAAENIDIDIATVELDVGDCIMLSCDGVHQHLSPQQIKQAITDEPTLELAAKKITQIAQTQGSLDNLTCLLIHVVKLPKQAFSQLLFERKQQVIPPPLPIGAKLDQYQILDVLEQSTRSHIYLAKDTSSQQLRVIKAPSLNFSDDEIYLDAFIKEGWLGDKINQPAIMKIYPPNSPSQFLYHICQYIAGQTLSQWHQSNRSPALSDVREFAKQIIKILRTLQRNDVIHGDIKPDNFMVDSDNRITLIDLGSCDVGAINTSQDRLLGTLTYSAPELFYGQNNTVQSDLFSVAVLLYQLLSNHFPYKEISQPHKVPRAYSQWRYRPITGFRQDLPHWLDIVLSKALAPDPAHRYQSYSEFITDLTTPQQSLMLPPAKRPLIEREPIRFWQVTSLILFLLLLASLLR